ncbi:MAG TPA: ISL3 family transposase [Ktedonobacteraceae bacterium]|nr:ISL3 family transposase [Ktedonobacteraceae bacterium]
MVGTSLFSLLDGMVIDQIQVQDSGLLITVSATEPTARCPLCGETSASIHSHYSRMLGDLPCAGRAVYLALTVRKFYCRNPLCLRKVFAERLAPLARPWARMTIRLHEALQAIGLFTCGKSGARLATRLGMPTSRDTILRRIMALPERLSGSILYLGIDDFSFRRGQWFGTLLIDLESHRPVDLLPDRLAESSARWMQHHPEIQVVSRDRGAEYASAASQGAPQALQCADRFHVVKNLTEATQLLLARCQTEIADANKAAPSDQSQETSSVQEWRPNIPAHVQRVQQARRDERSARYQQAIELSHQGKSSKEIAGRLGVAERTIRRWFALGTNTETKRRRRRPGSFEIYAQYVLSRWKAGERNGLTIYREIKEQGYTGSARTVYRYLEPLKQAEGRASVDVHRLQKFSANTAIWLFVRPPERLDEIEQEDLAAFLQASPSLKRAYVLIQDFLTMVHQREGFRLDAWLEQVEASDLTELHQFAHGIELDKEAVQAGLTWPINNGVVEGNVTKLKLIKRQMYGKAGFPLLRKRVLHAL